VFTLITPSSDQVQTLGDQFNDADASIDGGDGRSIVTRQGFLVTSEVPEGLDVAPDEFAIVEPRDGFPSVLILGQNQLVAPFIAGLDEINLQSEPGEAISLFDQTRNGGGSNLADVDPADIDEVLDLFVGSDILDADADAGKVTAVEPSAEQFDAILENLEGDGGLTPGGFAVGPLPRALENVVNPDPNQIVLTPAGTTSDGQEVPPALFVENLRQVAVFQAALEEAGLDQAEINNLVNNVFNPLRNDQLQEFDADAVADISTLFQDADIVNGGAVGIVASDEDDNAGDDDGAEDDAGDDAADNDVGDVIGTGGGARFTRFEPNAEQLSDIREGLEEGEELGISVDNFAVGEIPPSLNDPSSNLEILVTEGGVDAEGNEVPPSLLFDPEVLERQANLRLAAQEAFPDDPETRNLLQRQFDQTRNDGLNPFEVGDDVDDVTEIFDGLNLPEVGDVNVVDEDVDNDGSDDVVENDPGGDGIDVADDGVVLEGTQGGDQLTGSAGDDIINGLTGRDEIRGRQGNDLIDAGGGEDLVRGNRGDDTIIGGGGQDELFGGRGNDVITGGIGDDQLFGGSGDDILNGELVNDTITTGSGNDTIIFEADGGNDRITDFEAGVDRLQINGFGDNPNLEAVQNGDNTILRINGNDRIVLENFDVSEFSEDDVAAF